MILYIDCEFNDFQGELISLALVDEVGREFYSVLPCLSPSPWVAANVIPVLGQAPEQIHDMRTRLQAFLSQYLTIHIIADWPEDIAHFCRALITGPGMRMDTPALSMEVRSDLDGESKLPHNALLDAHAIRVAHRERMRKAVASLNRSA